LKKQVNALKVIVRTKDDEITNVKQNTKFAKFAMIEGDYHKLVEDYGLMKQHNEFLQSNLQEYKL